MNIARTDASLSSASPRPILDRLDHQIIFDSIADGIVAVSLDYQLLYMNRAAKQLLGCGERIEVFGRPCREMVRTHACLGGCVLRRTIERGEPLANFETVLRTQAGTEIPVSLSTALIRNESGEAIGGVEIFRDISLIKELSARPNGSAETHGIVSKNGRMAQIMGVLPQIAQTRSTVLITGESGTGKELIAEALHRQSPRKGRQLVKVNCAALSEGLIESELFGHVRGAFTGAIADKAGRFELADGGTLFLDEAGEIPPKTQAKLLRVLESGEFERVGDSRRIKADVRLIAATNKDLARGVETGEFRKDLFYRLNVVPIHLPPLRERRDDIPLLIRHFVSRFQETHPAKVNNISPEAMKFLLNYDYPGNIRELQNVIEHAFACCEGNTILPEDLPLTVYHPNASIIDVALREPHPFRSLERELIKKALDQSGWNIIPTAKRLGMSRSTLWRRMRELGIDRPDRP